jgi:GGDEF domain-containing protein
MYMWPILWTTSFYGRRATIAIVVCIATAHGVALAAMPPGVGNVDRWVDVVVSVTVVAAVVRALAARNERLVVDLKAEARVDALTGLLNRRGFEERLAVETARAARDGSRVAIVAFDVDHFKSVNDERGHAAGDRALATLGAVIREHARAGDLTARWGGEEFVVVMPRAGVEAASARRAGARRPCRDGHGRDGQRRRRSGRGAVRPAGADGVRRRGALRGQARRARLHGGRGRAGRELTRRAYSPGGWRTT